MQTVLLTGANGFVGCYVAKKLIEKDIKVIATGRGNSRFPFLTPNLTYDPLDFTDAKAVNATFSTYTPNIVIHCGALSKPDDCAADKEGAYTTNVTGTEYLLAAASEHKSFFIFLSTDFIFNGEKGMYKEEDGPAPVNYYGETKVLAEEALKNYPHDWCIVRTVLVYGDPLGGKDNIVTSVVKGLKEGKTLNIYHDQVRTPTYVEDLATAIVTITERKKKGIFHISGKDVLTPYEIACVVAGHLGYDKGAINKVTRESFQQGAPRPSKTCFDISKARQQLNYEPVSFTEGLAKTFESYGGAKI